MIIVAEDGVAIEPVTVGSFQINNGQRECSAFGPADMDNRGRRAMAV